MKILVLWLALIIPGHIAWGESPNYQIKIQNYLNGLNTLGANFSQHNPDGSFQKGKLWIKKYPDKMGQLRLQYEPPYNQTIIATDGFLTIYEEDGNQSDYDIDYTPAAFVLKNHVAFEKELSVIEIKESDDKNFVLITLTRKGDEDGPSLTLIFKLTNREGIQQLVMWEVIDMQQNKTVVVLDEDSVRVNDPSLISPDTFVFKK